MYTTASDVRIQDFIWSTYQFHKRGYTDRVPTKLEKLEKRPLSGREFEKLEEDNTEMQLK